MAHNSKRSRLHFRPGTCEGCEQHSVWSDSKKKAIRVDFYKPQMVDTLKKNQRDDAEEPYNFKDPPFTHVQL